MKIFHKHNYIYCGVAYSDCCTFSVYYYKKCKAIKTKRVESLTFDSEIRRARQTYPTLTALVDKVIRSYAENKS